jgi:hypothetical protein
MPIFWEKMSPTVRKNGIELTNLLTLNTSAGIWTPDIRFHDVVDVDYVVEVGMQIIVMPWVNWFVSFSDYSDKLLERNILVSSRCDYAHATKAAVWALSNGLSNN